LADEHAGGGFIEGLLNRFLMGDMMAGFAAPKAAFFRYGVALITFVGGSIIGALCPLRRDDTRCFFLMSLTDKGSVGRIAEMSIGGIVLGEGIMDDVNRCLRIVRTVMLKSNEGKGGIQRPAHRMGLNGGRLSDQTRVDRLAVHFLFYFSLGQVGAGANGALFLITMAVVVLGGQGGLVGITKDFQ
jgi:hypothetical protein